MTGLDTNLLFRVGEGSPPLPIGHGWWHQETARICAGLWVPTWATAWAVSLEAASRSQVGLMIETLGMGGSLMVTAAQLFSM